MISWSKRSIRSESCPLRPPNEPSGSCCSESILPLHRSLTDRHATAEWMPRSIRDAWHIPAAPSLYGRERVMRVRGQIDLNTVAGADLTPIQDNRHDSGFANDGSLDVTIQCRGHQAGHEAVELDTGISKSFFFDESAPPETQARAGR